MVYVSAPETFNLSEKIYGEEKRIYGHWEKVITSEDVKEFIRLLKKEFRQNTYNPMVVINEIIDKLAGEELSK